MGQKCLPRKNICRRDRDCKRNQKCSRKGAETSVHPKLIVTPMNCAKETLANKSFVIETGIVEVISDALIKFVTSSSVTEIQTAPKDTNAKIKCVYHPVMIPKIVPKITFVTTPIASLSFVNVTQIAMLD